MAQTSGVGRGGRRSDAGRRPRDIGQGLEALEACEKLLKEEARRRAGSKILQKLKRANQEVRKAPKRGIGEHRTLKRGDSKFMVFKTRPISAEVQVSACQCRFSVYRTVQQRYRSGKLGKGLPAKQRNVSIRTIKRRVADARHYVNRLRKDLDPNGIV